MKLIILKISIFISVLSPLASAQCIDPVGVPGEQIYNRSYKLMQYCNGADWVTMTCGENPSGSSPCAAADEGRQIYNFAEKMMQFCNGSNWIAMACRGKDTVICSKIGDICPDGTVYAGLTPDGNVPMYTTPADAGQFSWGDGSMGYYTDTSMVNCSAPGVEGSCRTGEANTELLAAEDSNSGAAGIQLHNAAQYCTDLISHGKDDWYLPAYDELRHLYLNQAIIGGFSASSGFQGFYWSSSEGSVDRAHAKRFISGDQISLNQKLQPFSVRCVRRD